MAPDALRIERAPWSALEDEFVRTWGRPNGKDEPEHVEIIGPMGSGKTFWKAHVFQRRVRLRRTGVVSIATKPADKTMLQLGWPIAQDWSGVKTNPQVILWPRTKALGRARRAFQGQVIQDVLDRLWVPDSNNIVDFDEIAYAESLSPELRDTIETYLREGRSSKITVVAGKQRPQGVTREMHGETVVKVIFRPADFADAERCAELLGSKREWVPVLMGLNRDRYEFVIKLLGSDKAFVSWVDTPLAPPPARSVVKTEREKRARFAKERTAA